MPQGDKKRYTEKQKRKAEHIEEGYIEQGVPRKVAEARAWATVNKQDGGGKKSGSGRGRSPTRTAAERSASAKRAAATRARNRANKG
jgi:plasmid stabilization system protein ParE